MLQKAMVVALVLGLASGAQALIKVDGTRNLSAPTGIYAGRGYNLAGYVWQQGVQLPVNATPIAPYFFIAAKHTAGSFANLTGTSPPFAVFNHNGGQHQIVSRFDHPTSDLTIFQVQQPFSTWAELYDGSDEAGRELFATGYGIGAGAQMVATNGHVNGWRFAAAMDEFRSWGTNSVDGIVSDPGLGEFLHFDFDGSGGTAHESIAGPGDSGGSVFIEQNGVWKLAGVMYGLDGYYDFQNFRSGPNNSYDPFWGAIYDGRGLWQDDGSGSNFQFLQGPNPIPASSYATRLSSASNRNWINNVLSTPEPSSLMLGLLALPVLGLLRRRR